MPYCMLDVDKGYERAAAPRSRQNDADQSPNRVHRHRKGVRMTSTVNDYIQMDYMFFFMDGLWIYGWSGIRNGVMEYP